MLQANLIRALLFLNTLNNDKIILMKKIIKTAILIGFLIMMYCLSAQNGNESLRLSNSLLDLLINWIKALGNFRLGFISSWINSLSDREMYLVVSYYFRKTAHFGEYFILFILTYECFKEYKFKHVILISLLFCLACAGLDEFHQYFVSMRAASIKDCVIDFFGSLCGYLFWHHLCKK